MNPAKTAQFFGVLLLMVLLHGCAATRPHPGGQVHFITIEEELRLGEEIASFSVQHLKIIRNRSINHFISGLAVRIGQVSHWQGLQYTIFVINENDVNHFSLPGGNIYLFRGLLEICTSIEEVAAVIAHEISHVAMRDGVGRLAQKYGYSLAAQQIIGDNPEIAEHIIRSLYKPDTILDYAAAQEFAADQLAVEYLRDAGFSPAGLYSLLQKIQIREESGDPQVTLLSFTHPAAKSRLQKLKRPSQLPQATALKSDDLDAFKIMMELLTRLPR